MELDKRKPSINGTKGTPVSNIVFSTDISSWLDSYEPLPGLFKRVVVHGIVNHI